MKAALSMTLENAPPGVDLPLAGQLLCGACSAVGALLAVAHLEHFMAGRGALIGLLYVQATLLAVLAVGLAAAVDGRLGHWESRVAPMRSRVLVRAELLARLGQTAGIGLAGPLLLAALMSWQAADSRPLLGALATLLTAFCAGFCAVSAWRGRAPRWLLLPALASLLALLAVPGILRALCGDGVAAPVVLALALLALWRCVLARQALAARAKPWPRPDLRLWWRRASAQRSWAPVRYQSSWQTMSGETRKGGAWTIWLLMPQFLTQATHLHLLAWGQAYDHAYAAPAYGLWLAVLSSLAYGGLIAPRLHWRRRLAPRDLLPLRWARSLVLGSLLAGAVLFSLGVGLAMLINSVASRPVHGDAWLPAMGDVLLATSFGAWIRGRHEGTGTGLLLMFGAFLVVSAALALLQLLGIAPQRGALWLLLQLALVLPLIRAAIRAWSRRDLNLLA